MQSVSRATCSVESDRTGLGCDPLRRDETCATKAAGCLGPRMAGCATPTGFAGQASGENINSEWPFHPDRLVGANHWDWHFCRLTLGGAKTTIASRCTWKVAGVEVDRSPSVFTSCGRRVDRARAVHLKALTLVHRPCVPV